MKLSGILKGVNKFGGTAIEDSPYANINGWYDTGSFALNRVISGSIYNGIPKGRITTFYGASSSGKSLIACQTAAIALKANQLDVVYIFDSEGGTLTRVFKNMGCDMSKIIIIPVESVEKCSTKMIQLYESLITAREEFKKDPENNDDIRALVILDSFGFASDKMITDAVSKDKMVADMGITAKLKNAMIKCLMMRVVMSEATLLVINHSYEDPSAMFTSKVKNMGGGKGIEYASHVIIQCEKLLIKSSDGEFLSGNEANSEVSSGFYKGNKLKFFTVKNRVSIPCFTAQCYIDFSTGLSKYDGLIEDAIAFGFIEKVHGGYLCKTYSDKKLSYRDLVSKDEIWNTFIKDFDNKSKEVMEYSNSTTRELDKIEQILDDKKGQD